MSDEIIVGGNTKQFTSVKKHPYYEFPQKTYITAIIEDLEKMPVTNMKDPSAEPKDGIAFTYAFPTYRIDDGTEDGAMARVSAFPIGLSMDKRANLFRMLQAICGENNVKEYQRVNLAKLKGIEVKVMLKKKTSKKGTPYFVVQDWDGTDQSKALEIGFND